MLHVGVCLGGEGRGGVPAPYIGIGCRGRSHEEHELRWRILYGDVERGGRSATEMDVNALRVALHQFGIGQARELAFRRRGAPRLSGGGIP